MSPPAKSPDSDGLLEKLLGSNRAVDVLQKLAALSGVLTAAWGSIKGNWWGTGAAAVVLAVTGLWYYVSRRWQRRRRAIMQRAELPASPKAYLRGLLPFERGETLLGRDADLKSIFAVINREEFRFGYISGEAGAGKTSFVRAALVPALETAGWIVIYVPRLGIDPLQATRNELLRRLPAEARDADSNTKVDLLQLVRASPRSEGARLILVYDQFEQFFLTSRSTEARHPFIEQLAECCVDEKLPLALLITLRKEFVDDLQDFEASIGEFADRRNKHRLRNWEAATAIDVLGAAAKHDGAPFAEELIEMIVADLADDGIVRPVELQVVATKLNESGIYEARHYLEAGRARGVLATHIRDFIEPQGDKTPELERQAARHLLRLLCSSHRDARRPQGLTLAQIVADVRESLLQTGQSALITTANVLEETISRLIRRGIEQYLLVMEDEQRVNLTHDYIVGPIRDATADVSSLEEQACRMLDQHLELQRLHGAVLLNWKQLRFIRRYATSARLATRSVSDILRRSQYALILKTAGIAIAGCILLSLLLPTGARVVETRINPGPARWIVSDDQKTAIAFVTNGESCLWRLNETWEKRIKLPMPFRTVHLSSHSKFLAGVTNNGDLYLWRTEAIPTKDFAPTLSRLKVDRSDNLIFEFAANDRWAAAASADGNCYLWDPAETLTRNPPPFATLPERKSTVTDIPGRLSPLLSFSPDGNWLLVIQRKTGSPDKAIGKLYRTESKELVADLGDVGLFFIVWGPRGGWLGLGGESREICLWDLRAPARVKSTPTHSIPNESGRDLWGPFIGSISPNERWLVARRSFGSFYVFDLDHWPEKLVPAVDLPDSSNGDAGEDPVFTSDSQYVAGRAQDGLIYAWACAKKPDEKVMPLIPATVERRPSAVAFSPRGSFVLVSDGAGRVYARPIGDLHFQAAPCAAHGTGSVAFGLCGDDSHFFSYGGFDVFFGEFGKPLRQVLRTFSAIEKVAVSGERKTAVVFTVSEAVELRRQFHVWGIPVWKLTWPSLAMPAGTHE